MLAAIRLFWSRRRVRRTALAVAGIAAGAVIVVCLRGSLVHRATAQPAIPAAAPSQPVVVNTAATATSDYSNRVVAYIGANQPITRQDLGEYLIARFGAAKLPLLLNKRLLDKVCAEHNVRVTAAEIEAALAEDLKGLGMDKAVFLKKVLENYKKNLYEWKEDVICPRIQMTRLIQGRVSVSNDELHKAFDTVYGEKVECRIIMWPKGQDQQALKEYASLRDSEAAFANKAMHQQISELAGVGGKLRPISRYTMDPNVENEVFKLQPGQVTTIIATPQGPVMLKCDKRIPADTTANFDAVKGKLQAQVLQRKMQAERESVFATLRSQARPQALLKQIERPEAAYPAPNQVVGYLYGTTPVTREELGEFLIARFGADKLKFLVNRRIIDAECKAKNIVVSEEEIDHSLQDDLKLLNVDKPKFEKDVLAKWGKNLYEWREDVIRPRLMLKKLCEGRVKCTEDDLKKCYDAWHGERLKCRVILWPTENGQDRIRALASEWDRLRNSEQEFDRKARTQANPSLASAGGVIPEVGHGTLGDEQLERAAFNLQEGEISSLIATPQGAVVIKCDKRIKPDGTPLEKVRAQLTEEVLKRKVQVEMQVVFQQLYKDAKPRMLIRPSDEREDLQAVTNMLNQGLPPLPGAKPGK
jgi:parvulin-like peptidyl-prolyl isomerase